MSKIKNGGLDQYGAEPFEQQQFGTAGVEGVNTIPFSLIRSKAYRVTVTASVRRPRGGARLTPAPCKSATEVVDQSTNATQELIGLKKKRRDVYSRII